MRFPFSHPFILPCLTSLVLATSTPGCRNDEPERRCYEEREEGGR